MLDRVDLPSQRRPTRNYRTRERRSHRYAVDQKLLDLELVQSAALNNIRLKELQAERAILGEKPAYYKKTDDQVTWLAQQQADLEVLIAQRKGQAEQSTEQKLAAQKRSIWDQTLQGFS